MMEYLKDWRIWVMCIIVVAVIECTDKVWAAEPHRNWKRFNVEEVKEKPQNVQFRPIENLRFKWKFNRVEGKYKMHDRFDFRTNFVVNDSLNVQAVSLFTWEF